MTVEQHAKTLSIAHLVYATIIAITASVVGWVLSDQGAALPATSALLLLVLTFAVMGPFLLTSYGVFFDLQWARASALVSVIFSILSFPLGTTLAIYTLWYFFSDKGRKLSR